VRQAGHDIEDAVRSNADKLLAHRASTEPGVPLLTALTRMHRGWDAPATVVAPERLDEAVAAGWQQVWRGVVRNADETAADIAEQTRTGRWLMGSGLYGGGVYTSTRRATAEDFRDSRRGTGQWAENGEWIGTYRGGDRGGLLRIAIDPEARLADYATLEEEWKPWLDATSSGPVRRVGIDPGSYAVMRGYDGIHIHAVFGISDGGSYPLHMQNVAEMDQYVIFNRSVLMIEERATGMTPDLSRRIARAFYIGEAEPAERGLLIAAAGPAGVRTIDDLPEQARALLLDLEQRNPGMRHVR
jgi:hypothetical protein